MQFRDLQKQYQVLKEDIDKEVSHVLTAGNFISGSQVAEISSLEEQLADYVGVKHCITCGNGTDALSLALMVWNIGPGDAVFVPDFTFFASGEVVAFEGAVPIFVDVEESKLYLFENGSLVNIYRCSGGKWSTPSPIGTWTITNKAKWGEGFGGSWMGLNVPWGDFGIHGTLEPDSLGWASSHGCIRMDNNEVAELYRIIPIGTKVTIVDGPYGAFGKGFRYLKSGMYGSDVFEIQKRLKELIGHTPKEVIFGAILGIITAIVFV